MSDAVAEEDEEEAVLEELEGALVAISARVNVLTIEQRRATAKRRNMHQRTKTTCQLH